MYDNIIIGVLYCTLINDFCSIDKKIDVIYSNHLTHRRDDEWTYHFEIMPVSDHMIYRYVT